MFLKRRDGGEGGGGGEGVSGVERSVGRWVSVGVDGCERFSRCAWFG